MSEFPFLPPRISLHVFVMFLKLYLLMAFLQFQVQSLFRTLFLATDPKN